MPSTALTNGDRHCRSTINFRSAPVTPIKTADRVVYKGSHALWDPASGASGLACLLLLCLPLVIAVAFVVQSAYDWSLRRATAR